MNLRVCMLVWPNGLCIDYTRDVIYWADAKLDRIETSDINGQHRRVLVTDIHHPFGLAVVTRRHSCHTAQSSTRCSTVISRLNCHILASLL